MDSKTYSQETIDEIVQRAVKKALSSSDSVSEEEQQEDIKKVRKCVIL